MLLCPVHYLLNLPLVSFLLICSCAHVQKLKFQTSLVTRENHYCKICYTNMFDWGVDSFDHIDQLDDEIAIFCIFVCTLKYTLNLIQLHTPSPKHPKKPVSQVPEIISNLKVNKRPTMTFISSTDFKIASSLIDKSHACFCNQQWEQQQHDDDGSVFLQFLKASKLEIWVQCSFPLHCCLLQIIFVPCSA